MIALAKRRWLLGAGGWLAAFFALFLVSRDNHPTMVLNVVASLIFIVVAAVTAELNRSWLRPALRGRALAYVGALALLLLVATLTVVLTIRGAYALLWRDDPRMFGFWTNMGLDFIVIAVLVGAAALLSWTFRKRNISVIPCVTP